MYPSKMKNSINQFCPCLLFILTVDFWRVCRVKPVDESPPVVECFENKPIPESLSRRTNPTTTFFTTATLPNNSSSFIPY